MFVKPYKTKITVNMILFFEITTYQLNFLNWITLFNNELWNASYELVYLGAEGCASVVSFSDCLLCAI